MPTYPYACTACDNRFEAVQSFSDEALTICSECGGRLRKVFSSVGVVFKGSGFYRTDSRGSAKASSDGGSDSGSDGGSKDAGSDGGSKDAGSNGSGGADKPATTSTPAAASSGSSSSNGASGSSSNGSNSNGSSGSASGGSSKGATSAA